MRTSRLLELLLLLQVRGRASARELASELEVSARTIYRDVAALAAAGVPVFTETGRSGGVRLLDGYRPGGGGFTRDEARAVVLAGIPSIASQMGFETEGARRRLLAAAGGDSDDAVRHVRERLIVEAEPWWGSKEDNRFLGALAKGVWNSLEVRIDYDRGNGPTSRVIQPMGLILQGGTWYVIGRDSKSRDAVYRVSRVVGATALAHRFEWTFALLSSASAPVPSG